MRLRINRFLLQQASKTGFSFLKFLAAICIAPFTVRDLFLMRDRATSISQVAIYRVAICVPIRARAGLPV